MTPTDATNLLRLFVGECSVCGGNSGIRGESRMRPGLEVTISCAHCNGAGATLKDATRENWPVEWWRCDMPRCPFGAACLDAYPFLPDLPTDDAAAVKVAERFAAVGSLESITPPEPGFDVRWAVYASDRFTGDTLGASLLAALSGEG